jgi:ferredoxin--NADP+ reductase
MRTLQVAVVGSGPAGLYTAEALIKQAAVLDPPCAMRVDVLDRLPTPYGLVRYGVAPDHKSIKSIADYLRGVLEHDSVSFIGGVHLGEDVTREDLLASYDAVVYATGAMRDRRMGIPGEDLPGSLAATDFVNWYCGHPDVDPGRFTLDAESVAVIGVGNVAVDVARILIRNPEDLRETDVSQPVLDALMASKVREVHMIGRRGPAQAKFTTKELRELGELDGVDVVVGEGEADLDAFDPTGESARLAEADRHVRGNYTVIKEWSGRRSRGSARRLFVRFWQRPTEIHGPRQVSGLTLERTRLDSGGTFTGTGFFDTLNVDMVLRSVGYQSVPLPGVPFDDRSYVVPNAEGRVLGPDGTPLPGEYVAGWLKRGPSGVIGTNTSDAAQTVSWLLADLAGAPGPSAEHASGNGQVPGNGQLPAAPGYPAALGYPAAPGYPDAGPGPAARASFEELLAARGIQPVSYADWQKIENAEKELAAALRRGARVKLGSREEIHRACGMAMR